MAVTEGGIIGKQNPSTPTSASGVWSANEVFLRNTASNEWPGFNAPVFDYNVLGGGGAGSGATYAGGGGGAALVTGTFAPLGGITYTVTIGAGGSGGDGGASSIGSSVTGAGGKRSTLNNETGGDNTLYSGGTGGSVAGGGGAGAGGNGGNARSFALGGDGGTGIAMPLHPTGLRVGGGGAGRGNTSFGGSQPNGTAVDGGGGSNTAASQPNRGGGGLGPTGSGASGRVILRYVDSAPAATTTGNPTITVSGGYRTYDFTSSGSITF